MAAFAKAGMEAQVCCGLLNDICMGEETAVPLNPASTTLGLSLVTPFGFLLGPRLIGSVAEFGGLRIGLAMLVLGLLIGVACAGMLKLRPAVAVAQPA
jgi:hypothetical protein